MQPGLLEIGKNPQDNTQLLLIHTDLFQRLLEKHQQVKIFCENFWIFKQLIRLMIYLLELSK